MLTKIINKSFIWFIITFGLCYVQNRLNASVVTPDIVNFTKKQYHAASQNWSIAFDKYGYTYFGNSMGLLEFDGISWRLYPSQNGSIIRTVAVDDNGIIYTGGYRELGYWIRDEFNQLTYHSLKKMGEAYFSTNEEFWNILIKDNRVYFRSFSRIYIYDSNEMKAIKPDEGLITFATKTNDDIYIALKDKGIYKIIDQEFKPFFKGEFFMNKEIRFFCQSPQENKYYIGTESSGLYIYDAVNKTISTYCDDSKTYNSRNKINRGLLTTDGSIVIGTILDGIKYMNPAEKIHYHFNQKNGLQSNTVLGLAQDYNGNLWVAMDGGIDFISLSKNKSYRLIHNEKPGAVYSAALYNQQLYIGTNQGLFKKPWHDNTSTFNLVPHTQDQVWDCKVIDHSLFIGHNSGTFLINNHSVKKISDRTGGYSIIKSPSLPETLIQSTYNDLTVYKKSNGEWKYSHVIKDFSNLIRYIEFDHRNNLWASHLYGGLYKLRLNDRQDSVLSFQYYNNHSASVENTNNNYRVFKVEGRVVFTTGERLYTYDDLNDSIIPYDQLNNQLKEYAISHKIIPTSNHEYWFISTKGMAKFLIQSNLVKKLNEYPLSLFNNNLIPFYENIIPLTQSEVFVCLENGYAIINTDSEKDGYEIENHNPSLRNIYLVDRYENKSSIAPANVPLSIPHTKNSIELKYSFPFINSYPIKFQYIVEGLMENWSSLQDKPYIHINRLPTGNYVIKLRAVNNWGKSSKEHKLIVIINPPFYKSKIAIVTYFSLIMFFIFYSKQVTVRKVKRNEKRKREAQEKEMIKLRNEKLRADLSFKSQQLASSTIGIIRKNEFLLSLKQNMYRYKQKLGNRYPDKYYQDIIEKIDNNISGQDDWKLFETNFDHAHEKFLLSMKDTYPELTPSDLKLCAYLRINLSSKEIAPLLGISVRGVENHRSRLRKKLKLNAEQNLTDFILQL